MWPLKWSARQGLSFDGIFDQRKRVTIAKDNNRTNTNSLHYVSFDERYNDNDNNLQS